MKRSSATRSPFEFQATYAINARYSATLTFPGFVGKTSSPAEHNGTRHSVSARGIGDMRLMGSAWLFNPAENQNGNISLGAGLKLPTGKQDAKALFYKSTGPEMRPVDISIQPGDGGWGFMLELAGYRKFAGNLIGYANGYYLINPRETNRAYTPVPFYGQIFPLSVPDQYLGRAGLAVANWPWQGLSVSFGTRITGVPARDLIGGSEGFRRSGYTVYAEPGISWSLGRNAFTLFIPNRIYANRTNSIYDDRYNGKGRGAFARHLYVTSWSRTF